jgi:predicted metal-binding protein
MKKIGILTCSNTTQDMNCASAGCFASMRGRQGGFERYSKDEELELVGIISCANCPTLAASDKILLRVKALVEFGAEVIHFAYCVDTLCPFKAKYKAAIKEAYPDIELVMGTHAAKVTPDQYRAKVNKLLCHPRQIMADITKGRVK